MLGRTDLSKMLIIDLEATCWEDKVYQEENSEIIDIGIVQLDLDEQSITKQFSTLVIPAKTDISTYCTKLTGITPHLVKSQGISLELALKRVSQELPTNDIVWGGWGKDKEMWVKACQAANLPDPFTHAHYIDLQWLYSMLRGKNEILSLHSALAAEGLEFVNGVPHRGLPDAYNTARVMLSLFSRIQFFGN